MVKLLIMKSQTIRVVVAIIIAGLVGYYIGITKINVDWKNYKPQLQIVNKEPPPSIMHADFAPFGLDIANWKKAEEQARITAPGW